MADPLVVGGVCRFSAHGMIGARPWANILDMHITSSGGSSRNDAILDQAKIINNSYAAFLANNLGLGWTITGTSWVDLNNADGDTGSTSEREPPGTMPVSGGVSGDYSAGNTSVLIIKRTSGGRSTRNGRMFLAGIPESNTAGSNLAGGALTSLQSGINGFHSAIDQNGRPLGGGGGYDSELVVVHRNPGTATGTFRDVEAMEVQLLLATQRRRLRG